MMGLERGQTPRWMSDSLNLAQCVHRTGADKIRDIYGHVRPRRARRLGAALIVDAGTAKGLFNGDAVMNGNALPTS